MNLTLITPCSRPGNLLKLRESINFPCEWFIVYDSEERYKNFKEDWIYEFSTKGGVSGNQQRNFGIELADNNSWLYFLDDDNLMHPSFYPALLHVDNTAQSKMAMVFDQQLSPSQIRRSGPATTKVTHIDQAQYTLKKELLGETRFIQDYCADGVLVEEVYKRSPDKFMFINSVLCYYNRLRW